ncbi:MAG: hypothetical protein IV100_29190 [Myxococcales bacterium]|nr:hypothetical protein [Myxococcales bacterium]
MNGAKDESRAHAATASHSPSVRVVLATILLAPLMALMLIVGLLATILLLAERSKAREHDLAGGGTTTNAAVASTGVVSALRAPEVGHPRRAPAVLPLLTGRGAAESVARRDREESGDSWQWRRIIEYDHADYRSQGRRRSPATARTEGTATERSVKLVALYGGALEFQGQRYERGHTPFTLLQPGTHTVRVYYRDCRGCISKTHTFTVGPKTPEVLKFRADFEDATLVVNRPAGARVRAAEKRGSVGAPISFPMSQPLRRVIVTVSKEGFQPKTVSATLETGAVVEKSVSLDPL